MNKTNVILKWFFLGKKHPVLGVLKYRKESYSYEYKATYFLRCTNKLNLTVK